MTVSTFSFPVHTSGELAHHRQTIHIIFEWMCTECLTAYHAEWSLEAHMMLCLLRFADAAWVSTFSFPHAHVVRMDVAAMAEAAIRIGTEPS
jgi:hypothetical protein